MKYLPKKVLNGNLSLKSMYILVEISINVNNNLSHLHLF